MDANQSDEAREREAPAIDNRGVAIMQAQFKKAVSEPNEHIKFMMSDRPNLWYILIGNFNGNEDEFEKGAYLVRMIAPADFPFNPPRFYFMTPNGVYEVEKKVCINIGEYHKDQYRAALGMAGFASQLVSGMIGWRELGNGINIVHTDAKKKRAMALDSARYNAEKHGQLIENINGAFDTYVAKWDKSKIPAPMRKLLGMEDAKVTTQLSELEIKK
jgi:ubiquitin-protein ligase